MLPTERMETSGDRPMMLQHAEGGVVFLLDAPMATVVEITIDFGRGLVRTLGMRRNPEGCWQLRRSHWPSRLTLLSSSQV